VVFQFAVSAGLLLCTAVMQRQLDFLSEKELGFEAEQVVQLVSIEGDRYHAYKDALQSLRGVESVSIGPDLPGGYHGLIGFTEEDPMRPESSMLLKWFETDHDLLRTMDMRLVAGRFFDPVRPTDGGETLVLNESGARAFGWDPEEAPGKVIDRGQGGVMPIIGVVEDFHAHSLRFAIEPLAIRLLSEQLVNRGRVLVRVAPDGVAETLEAIERQHVAFFGDEPFTYTFLDEAFATLFEGERRLRALVTAFSILALVIAALGVLGLVAHAAERRTKEIGIRKVLGATERSVVGLLSKELFVLVGAGFVIAAPVAYVGMRRWLEEFAYRIVPGAGLFLAVGAGLVLAALTVASTQALRAARRNPVAALRSE
jgi:putative ABC transport system permease protein